MAACRKKRKNETTRRRDSTNPPGGVAEREPTIIMRLDRDDQSAVVLVKLKSPATLRQIVMRKKKKLNKHLVSTSLLLFSIFSARKTRGPFHYNNPNDLESLAE